MKKRLGFFIFLIFFIFIFLLSTSFKQKLIVFSPDVSYELNFSEKSFSTILNFSEDSFAVLSGSKNSQFFYKTYEGGLTAVVFSNENFSNDFSSDNKEISFNEFSNKDVASNRYIVVLEEDSVLHKKSELIKKQGSFFGTISNFISGNTNSQNSLSKDLFDYEEILRKNQEKIVETIERDLGPTISKADSFTGGVSPSQNSMGV